MINIFGSIDQVLLEFRNDFGDILHLRYHFITGL